MEGSRGVGRNWGNCITIQMGKEEGDREEGGPKGISRKRRNKGQQTEGEEPVKLSINNNRGED